MVAPPMGEPHDSGVGRLRFRACLCWASVAMGVRYRALLSMRGPSP